MSQPARTITITITIPKVDVTVLAEAIACFIVWGGIAGLSVAIIVGLVCGF